MFQLLTTYVFPSIIIVFGFLLYYYFLVYVFIYLLALYLCLFLLLKICGSAEISYNYELGFWGNVYYCVDWLDNRYEFTYLSDMFKGVSSSQVTDEGLLENRKLVHKFLVDNLWGFPLHWGSNIYASLFSRWVRAVTQLLAYMKEAVVLHYVVYVIILTFLVFAYLLNMPWVSYYLIWLFRAVLFYRFWVVSWITFDWCYLETFDRSIADYLHYTTISDDRADASELCWLLRTSSFFKKQESNPEAYPHVAYIVVDDRRVYHRKQYRPISTIFLLPVRYMSYMVHGQVSNGCLPSQQLIDWDLLKFLGLKK
jgi:hypothetical protein